MTWLPTASGRVFEILNPDWRLIDFDVDMAEGLARIARFTGSIRSGPYSTGQHSVVGADAVYRATGDKRAAAAFLLHDGHEYILNDKTTPVLEAEAAMVEGAFPGMGRVVLAANRELKQRLDIAIYRAAGMGENGCPEEFRRIVSEFDIRMCATERAHLLVKTSRPWHPSIEQAEPIRLVGKLTVWPWHRTADEFRDRLRRYLPERFGAPGTSPKPGPRRDGARLTRQPQEA